MTKARTQGESKGRLVSAIALLALLLIPLVAAAPNNPGHDSLYIEETGDSQLTGGLNISDELQVANLFYSANLDILGNGTNPANGRAEIYALNDYSLNLLSPVDIMLYSSGGSVKVGPGGSTDLNVSGDIYAGNSLVQKRVSGTCGAGEAIATIDANGGVTCVDANATGVSTAGGWTNTSSVTSTSLDVEVNGSTLSVFTDSGNQVLFTTGATMADFGRYGSGSSTVRIGSRTDQYLSSLTFGHGYTGVYGTTTNEWTVSSDHDDDTLIFSGDGGLGVDDFLTLNQAGSIGIGTTNPSSRLHINGTSPSFQLQQSKSGSEITWAAGYYAGNTNMIIEPIGGDGLYVWRNDASEMIMSISTSSRRVSVGPDPVPDAQFAVDAVDSADIGIIVQGAAGQSANLQEWQNSSADTLLLVDPNGRLIRGNAATLYDVPFYFKETTPGGAGAIIMLDHGDTTDGTSNSGVWLRTGGASGGDPRVTYTINTVSDWQTGVDNSDGDAFKLSTSTTFTGNAEFHLTRAGALGINSGTPSAQLHVTADNASAIGTIIRGATAQSANLQEWQNSSSDVMVSIDSNGKLTIGENDYGTDTGVWFGDGDTGLYEGSDGQLLISREGAIRLQTTDSGVIFGSANDGIPYILSGAASSTSPGFTFGVDTNTGIGHAGADQLSLITGGSESMRLNSTGVFIANNQVCTAANGLCNNTQSASYQNSAAGWTNTSSATSTSLNVSISQGLNVGSSASGASDGQIAIGKAYSNHGGYGNALDISGGISMTRPNDASYTYLLSAFSSGGSILGAAYITPSAGNQFRFRQYSDDAAMIFEADNSSGDANQFLYGTAAATYLYSDNQQLTLGVKDASVGIGTGTDDPVAQLEVRTDTSGEKGLVIKGAASQSANLQEWQDSSGNALVSVESNGDLHIGDATTFGNSGYRKDQDNYLFWEVQNANTGSSARSGIAVLGQSGAYSGSLQVTSPSFSLGAGYEQWRQSALIIGTGSGLDGGVSMMSTGPITLSVGTATGDEIMRLTTLKTVGIGSSAPGAKLHVANDNASNEALIVQGAASQTANLQEWQNSSGDPMVLISNNGNLGLGSLNPDTKIDAYGNILLGDDIGGSGTRSTDTTKLGNIYMTTYPSAGSSYKMNVMYGYSSNTLQQVVWGGGQSGILGPIKQFFYASANTTDTSGGTQVMVLDQTGVGIGSDTTPDAQLAVDSSASSKVGLILQGAASQTANLQQWQNSGGSTLSYVDSSGRVYLPTGNTTNNALGFGSDGNTGFYERSNGYLVFQSEGSEVLEIQNGALVGWAGGSFGLRNEVTTASNPSINPDATDVDTGLGQAAEDQLSLIAGGSEIMRLNSTGAFIANNQVCTAANGLCNNTQSASYQSSAAGWTNTSTTTSTSLAVSMSNGATITSGDLIVNDGGGHFREDGNSEAIFRFTNADTGASAFVNLGVANDAGNNGQMNLYAMGKNWGGSEPFYADSGMIVTDDYMSNGMTVLVRGGSAADFRIYTNDGSNKRRMTITDDGYVGIGSDSTPEASLQVDALDASTRGILIREAASQTASPFEIQNSSNDAYFTIDTSGRIGIGGATVNDPITIIPEDNRGVVIRETDDGNDAIRMGADSSSGFIRGYAGGSETLFFSSYGGSDSYIANGQFGVGNSDPNATLDITGNVALSGGDMVSVQDEDGQSLLRWTNTNTGTNAFSSIGTGYAHGTANQIEIYAMGLNSAYGEPYYADSGVINTGSNMDYGLNFVTQSTNSNADMRFYTNNGNLRMVIDKDGAIGIGTQNPERALHLNFSTALQEGLLIENTGAAVGSQDPSIQLSNSVFDWSFGLDDNNGDAFVFSGSTNLDTPIFTLGTNGRVGVGTDKTPDGQLAIDIGSSGTTGLIVQAAASQTANLQEWQNSSGDVVSVIDEDGRLGVGVSSLPTLGSIQAKEGIRLGTQSSSPWIFPFDGQLYSTPNYDGQNIALFSTSTSSGNYGTAVSGQSISITSGSYTNFVATQNFQPTSGNANFENVRLMSYVNQQNGASGTVVNLALVGQITNVSDYYSIKSNYGKNLLMAGASNITPLLVQAAASQTANLQEWQNSSGSTLAYVDNSGDIFAQDGQVCTAANGLCGGSGGGGGGWTNTSTTASTDLNVNITTGNLTLPNGWLGIGTNTPQRALEVDLGTTTNGIVALFHGTRTSGSATIGMKFSNLNTAGKSYIAFGEDSGTSLTPTYLMRYGSTTSTPNTLEFYTSGTGNFYFNTAGGVGIGDITPDAKLDVYTGSSSTVGLIVQAAASQTANLLELQNGSGSVLSRFSADGDLYLGDSRIYEYVPGTIRFDDQAWFDGNIENSGGGAYFSIRDEASTHTNPIYATRSFSSSGLGGTGNNVSLISAGVEKLRAVEGGPVQFKGAASQNITEWHNNLGDVVAIIDDAGNLAIGNSDPNASLDVSGNIRYSGNLTGYGADLAELIHSEGFIEPGDLVVINLDNDETVERSTKAYDTLVAGVISERPSHLMSADEGDVPLALSGRVPVKVTNENGPIRRGDLLTSSSVPGHAMRCIEAQHCAGALIGKALENLEGEEGKITALIMLG
jgi:hypothetical protein